MMSRHKSAHRQERGQAAAEFLLVFLILVMVTFGGLELARGVSVRSALDSGASAAARALSLNPSDWAFAAHVVQDSVDQNLMGGPAVVSLQVYDSSGALQSAGWLGAQPFGTEFILQAAAPLHLDIPLLPVAPITFSVRHWGIVERYP